MKKILYSLIIFASVFFVVDKVSALPSGSNLNNKEELGQFYVNNGVYWVSLYGNGGTGSNCGTISSPNTDAPRSCWTDGTLSFTTDSLTYQNYKLTSLRLYSDTPLIVGNLYHVTINYTLTSTSYSNYANLWKLSSNDYDITSFSSKCDGVNCSINFIVKNLHSGNQNDIWLNLNSNSYTFNDFNSAVAYWYMPQVEMTSYEEIFGFKEVAPVFNSEYTSTQLNSFLNNTSPTLSYGSATYDYMVNNFIPNEVYKEYGQYYLCLGSGTAYRSYCFISDDVEAFNIYDHGSSFFRFNIDTSVSDVYAYSINNGSKEDSNSDWYTSSHDSHTSLNYQLSHTGVYLKTNLPYIKYTNGNGNNTFKTADGYMFNPEDIILYKDGTDFVVNTDYKTSIGNELEPYVFDEYIEDYNYSKMIFDFDLSVLADRENIFDLLVNDIYVSDEIRDSILYEVERFEIGYPYFEYVTSSGYKGLFYLKDLDGNDITKKRKMYTGKYLDILPDDTVSLKFIIPLLDTVEDRLKISLVSYYPFTISYETDEEYFLYRETLVVNGKYGAIFMPKLVENNSDITTYFDTRCIDKILVYNTYDYKKDPIEVYDNMSQEFYYTILYENIDYNLFFISSTSSTCPTFNIDYDTRYFDYQIVDTKYTIGNVINPNTGQLNHIDFSNTSNIESDFDSLSGVFTFISKQLDKNNSAYLLFYDSVNTFFNTMPVDVYVLVLTVFAVILLGVTLALGGWK